MKAEPLIPNLPKPGKIKKETTLSQWDATEWTLSNGVKVIVKPTKFKDNEIFFSAIAVNGTAADKKVSVPNIKFLPYALGQFGLGSYSNSDLQKYLSGKQAMLNLGMSSYSRTVSGYSTPKDLPTLMELIYMGFTNVNFTPEEFEALQSTFAGSLKHQEKDPQFIFQTKLYESLFPNNPRLRAITAEDVTAADRAGIVELVGDMTANAAEYTFVFIGNVDPATLRPLVEQYIATLPADAKKARKKVQGYDKNYEQVSGTGVDTYTTKMENPQTWCYITAFGSEPYTSKNAQLSAIAGQILSTRLVEIVREKEGAVYSISASGSMDRIAPQNVEIVSAFPMKPEKKAAVLEIIKGQIDDLANNVSQAELDKQKEYYVKSFNERRERNNGWLGGINGWLLNGVDTFNGDIETLNAITVDDVKNFMKVLNKQGNYRVVILDPEQ